MKYKKMLGETIYRLRKEKGLSQAELGNLVGVSNKAVSKWETDEANPDIALLPLLAQAFEVSLDELFQNVKPENHYNKPKEGKQLGMKGTEIITAEKYEFISDKKTKKGVPYLHVHLGKTINTIGAKAHGVIAIGNRARGVIAIGFLSAGVLSLGMLSVGILALGALALGLLLAMGGLAVGGAAFGGVAIGVVAFGGVAIGVFAFGGLAIGVHAFTGPTGIAIGKYITIGAASKLFK